MKLYMTCFLDININISYLQRFEHSNKFHKKISTPVQFPEELNMGPFTTEYRNAEINGKNGNIPLTLIPDGYIIYIEIKEILMSMMNF